MDLIPVTMKNFIIYFIFTVKILENTISGYQRKTTEWIKEEICKFSLAFFLNFYLSTWFL